MVKKIVTAIKKWNEKRKNKFINLNEALYISDIQKNSYNPNKDLVNVVIGGILILYGGVTFFLPTGSIWAIMLGLFLISCPIGIKTLIRGLWEDIKFYVGVRI